MLFCEDCRIKKNWGRPPEFPFCALLSHQCEVCKRDKSCYDHPALFLIPDSKKTTEEKLLDKVLQAEYHKKAEELCITFVQGPRAGSIDHQRTEDLKKILIKENGEVNWYSTHAVRKLAQEGHEKFERIKHRR
jgi:hypothetical protein